MWSIDVTTNNIPLPAGKAAVSVLEYAKIFDTTPKAVRGAIGRKQIAATKTGREYRIPIWFIEKKLACEI